MSVVKRKAERRIAPGGESRGRVEENRAKVCGTTKAPDKNEKDQNGHGFADRLKKRRAQISRNLAGESTDCLQRPADKRKGTGRLRTNKTQKMTRGSRGKVEE